MFSVIAALLLLQQPTRTRPVQTPPTERQMLEAEYSRSDNVPALIAGTRASDPRVQRIAVRGLGRLERPAFTNVITPLLSASDAGVRAEAVNALAQLGARFDFAALLRSETDGVVRGVIYESIGRVRATPDGAERDLATGLADGTLDARAGAARGLESLIRRNARTMKPSAATIGALRTAARDASQAPIATALRENALLALVAAGDRDSLTIATALRDRSDQVRRVAVMLAMRYLDDPSYIVRLQGLRWAGTCERFIAATNDVNEHVALTAIDSLGGRSCGLATLLTTSDKSRSWRTSAHATVALAKLAPDSARARTRTLALSPVWQARVYAADAASVLHDSATLRALARDPHPNVAIAGMTSLDDALRALASESAPLVMAGVDWTTAHVVRASANGGRALVAMLAALDRFSAMTSRVTVRDPRVRILTALAAQRDSARILPHLRALFADRDPAVAELAATTAVALGDVGARATSTRYVPPALPPEGFMRGLRGATAQITMRGLGTIEVMLLSDDAPVTVALFAALADSGKFNGLTFHRIVPNFVLQGGSPGANEYSALTPSFMRDEVGLVRHDRGTFGISTRGRDTGDGQIFINLVDNYRLDHDYTVFARTTRGLDVIDRVQEGDVIESIRVVRAGGK